MNIDKEYVIRLSGLDLGQVIDGLEARAQAWRSTAHYLETGEAPEGFVMEECSDAEEAQRLADSYKRIVESFIRQQRQEQ
jgi:hypothetical protein